MDSLANTLGKIGGYCGQNKYLASIRNAFQNYMPATIAGALSILWCFVLVNDESGLGTVFPAIMNLDILNPVFEAIQYATISCITLGIVILLSQELAIYNKIPSGISCVVALAGWICVTQTNFGEYSGLMSEVTGATGLFTGIVVSIVTLEIYTKLSSIQSLKITMPDQVPPGVAKAFEAIIPAFITLVIIGLIGQVCVLTTGFYVNDIIFNVIQKPLQVVGGTLPGLLLFILLIQMFWIVGIHGNNMIGAVLDPILTVLMLENMNAYTNGMSQSELPNIINKAFQSSFVTICGSGIVGALTVAIFICGKREDNRAIAKLSAVPNIFNINETIVFGVPIVLNPIIGIPFILAPMVSAIVAYTLTAIGFCPKFYIEVPWTTPLGLSGFLASGGDIMGAITQLVCFACAVLVYLPFVMVYEKYQNKQVLEASQ